MKTDVDFSDLPRDAGEQTFDPPVFLASLSLVKSLELVEDDGFVFPAGGSDHGWEAHYVLDQEIIELLKKRQPIYVYGSLPDGFERLKDV